MVCLNLKISSFLRGILIILKTRAIFCQQNLLLNVTESLCNKAASGESLIPNISTKDVHLTNDLIPTLSTNSNFSNTVSVTKLSSTLIDGFGDSYAIVVIGVTHDEIIEWQSVSPTGSALKLPTINNSKIKIDKNSSLEVQYDNRFGLFHIETNFETEFPSKILILSPTDRIRFKLLSNLSLSLSNCEIHSLWFTFFKTNSLITKFLDTSQISGKEIINIEKCKFWPFSNIIYRLCPGYEVSAANTTTPNHSFSTLINKITEGTTIESKSFTKDNTLSDKILTSSTSKQLPSTTNSGKNGNSQSSNPSSTQAMQNIINTKTISNSNDESPSTLIIDNEKETLESKFADPLISKSSSLLTNSPTTTITKKELSSPFQEAKASATTLTPINLQFISISSSSSEIIREQRSTPMPPSTTQKLTLETTGAGNTVTASTPQIVTDKVWMSSSGVESSKTATTLNIETTATVTTSTYNTQSVTTSTPSISNTNQATTVGSLSKTTTTQISSTLEIKPNTVLTSTTERSERDITQQSSLTTDTKSTSGSMTSTMNNTNEISSSPLSLPSVSPTSTSPPPPPSIAFSQQDSSSPPTTSPPKIFSASSNSATTLKNIKSGCSTTDESGLCKYCTKGTHFIFKYLTNIVLDLSTKQCIVTVYPQLFDINVTLQVSKDLDEIGKIECNLINKDTLQNIQIKVKIDDNTIEIEFTPQNGVNEMKLSCLIDETEFLSNKTIFISSFQSLVEHKTPFASGFDSSNEHKTIYVTFKEAIPLQFIYAAGSNNAFCVLDQKSGPKYSAKLETPSVMSCNLNGSVTTGSHKLFAIRQPELADATFQYQIPITFSIYSPTTAPSQNTKTAEFLSSLKGILVKFDLTTDIKNRTFNCSKVFMSSETFGTQAICQMTDSELKITFGAAPTILPHQPLLVRSGALTNAYLDGERPNTTQYDAIELKVPADAITPSITLQEPTAAFACQQNVNLSVTIVSGDAGRNMTYKWKLKSGGTASLGTTLSQTTSSFIQIPTIDIGSGASISVEACNFVNKCSESNTVEIKSSEKTFQFTVSIAGIPSTTLPSSKISLSAIPSFASCNSSRDLSMTNISYEWSINGTSVSHDSVYIVPAKTYAPYSALTITVLAKYWNSEAAAMLEATSEEGIVYGIEGLVGIVDGIERAIASDTELLIDARQSFDPNTGNNNLIHSWTCTKDGGINCTNLDLNWKSKLLVVASGVLKPGQNYTFTDTISNGLGSSTQISVTVHILQGSVPIIQLVPLTEKSLPFDSYIRVQGYVQSKSELSTEWQLFTFPDNLAVDISKVFPQVKRNFSDNGNNAVVSVSFTIPPGNNSKYPEWKGLNPGQYIVRLMATNMVGSSFTEHTFEILPLPKKPTLAMSPMKDMFALQTPIQLSAKDIPPSADKPISLRFGFRTILVNNKTMDKWFRASALDYYKTILAAAWPEPHAACNERVAYQGLLEICSFDGACSQTQSPRFVVQHPLNSSIAFSQILTSATSDITSGDLEGALVKLEAIQREQCNTSIDGTVVDALITKVLTNLQNSTDSDSLLIGVGICTAVINSASKENVDKVMELLLRAQKAAVSSRSTTSTPTRQKRSSTATAMAALPAMSVSPVVESAAETFLISYDSLLTGNQDLSTAYIKMITDFLAGFCVQLDSNRILSAEGNGYTFIQAEGLSPFDENFLNQSYSAANVEKSITFGTNFQSVYKSFKCGESKIATCSNICLATADIAKAALIQNTHLQQYFFSSSYNSITFASAMSDFYLIRFIDPNSGNEVPLTSGAAYNFSIPLLNYAAANYYSCFVFVNGIWRNNMCKSNDFGTKIDSKYFLQCYCEITGVLAVFTVSAPTPKYYPPYNEIELKFNLSTITACTSAQLSNFLGTLSTNSGVGAERFRNYSCNPGTNISTDPSTIILRLRPPFRFSHISNSFAMQAIKRAVTVGNKMIAYGKVEVTALNATTIYRTLEGDERGRRVPLRIDRSYREVVGGNDTEAAAMAIKWAKNLAKDMNIDSQRFKNPIILMGNFF
uniref:PKD/REJ-like domain-containing protein n=1 Tax=Panagrolaimus sp. PS1159 TaxID=55785 RepID=A0AC35GIE2_9BILA